MSSPEPNIGRRALLCAVGGALLLGGCGFRPMLGEGAGGDALDGIVAIQTPEGRNGFALREALEKRLGRAGPGAPWRLTTTLALTESGTAITADASITRYVLRGESNWALSGSGAGSGAGGEAALSGQVQSMSAYSATGSLYATRTARRAAQRRVAEDLGQRIAIRLAAALADGRGAAAGVTAAPAAPAPVLAAPVLAAPVLAAPVPAAPVPGG
jgi:LPS-assembly lipoprotein